ncbi:2-polyprenyl-6-methoxyphenol hydroxylase [Pseudonocardia thermophila]|jgi:2-polyprenyl-6-methoxyphenol hydroxylase and related FAD-dependent oxidoreductases|uniref:2-polyprenyl-6-methoxyphenol hydroxylase n=1 Tax=Pseudonocardia thermophila TaxID=1848 RepID=A0A1M6T446_PSETH|nr:FAD-dependent monooxygenase [Pseudonocardia thermophila]SHK51783.1 2-polyprenyl-6-methoxyphenol hydroxylase [Pseudonocardia thermophila]
MKILVVGAGVAGLSATINLQRRGHAVTLLEVAPEIRTSGSPIDVRGDALDMVREMGILDEIRAAEIRMSVDSEFVDDHGNRIAGFSTEHSHDRPDDIEITRPDLMRILVGALEPGTDLRFATTVADLAAGADGVHVSLTDGTEDDFDLVVGADGVHSRTRSIVFGPEADYVRFLGVYLALAPVGPPAPEGTPGRMHLAPGRMMALLQSPDAELAGTYFRSPKLDVDHHDPAAVRGVLRQVFRDDVWRVHELIDRMVASPGLFFDECSQTRMPRWSVGRVVLVGDAAHCAAPLSGRGTSLGISGGLFLAQAIEENPGDLAGALAEYERRQRPYVDRAQRGVQGSIDRNVPATADDVAARYAALRQYEASRA